MPVNAVRSASKIYDTRIHGSVHEAEFIAFHSESRCELIIRKFDDANKKIAGGSNQGQRLLTDGRTR